MLHHVLLVPTILSIALVVLVSWKLMYQHLLHYHTHNALNSFTTVHWPPHQFLIKGSVKGSDWPPHQQKDRPPHQPSNPIQPSLASAWFARPKEVFSEGLADQHKQLLMKQAADKAPDRVQIHSIHHLIAIGSVARQLGLEHIHFFLSPTQPFPHFESRDRLYHLSKSRSAGDPYWYVTKYHVVSKLSKQTPILAYQQPNPTAVGQVVLEPWQKNSHYDFWVKSKKGGSWHPSGEDNLKFVPMMKIGAAEVGVIHEVGHSWIDMYHTQ